MLLFICHASEDKSDFVEPLATELSKVYDVWYDEYRLTLGDSLFAKINEGLATCDFGIVVLSPAFFRKKWPQAELDGLFALEAKARKIILPIWKDVTREDVVKFSPILADRLAVSTSLGLLKVVSEIRLAVDVSERKRQLTNLESATKRLAGLDQSLAEKRTAQILLNSEEGVRLVSGAAVVLLEEIKQTLTEFAEHSQFVKFGFTDRSKHAISARTLGGIQLLAGLRESNIINSAASSFLTAQIFVDFDRFRESNHAAARFDFSPSFRGREVVWSDHNNPERIFGGHDVAGLLIDALIEQIKARTEGQDLR